MIGFWRGIWIRMVTTTTRERFLVEQIYKAVNRGNEMIIAIRDEHAREVEKHRATEEALTEQLREKNRVIQFIGGEREVMRSALVKISGQAHAGMQVPQPLQQEYLAFIHGYAEETIRTSGTPKT